jgi:hypothetical protein
MDSNEPKPVPETSTEPSDEGKELDGPSLVITLLLTTGSRHPFTIDGKYLKKRSVAVENNDPFLMSVYTLKELIWREWRSGMLHIMACDDMSLIKKTTQIGRLVLLRPVLSVLFLSGSC